IFSSCVFYTYIFYFLFLRSPLILFFFFYYYADHRDLHSFPTRRSSDLAGMLPVPGNGFAKVSEGTVPGSGSKDSTARKGGLFARSEEHTSELQSRFDLVCRLLLEKKKKKKKKEQN